MLTYKSNHIRADQQILGTAIMGGSVYLNKINIIFEMNILMKRKRETILPKIVSFLLITIQIKVKGQPNMLKCH